MLSALAHSPGPRMAGAFMKCTRALPTSPTSGATNTSSTVTLQAKSLDPLKRSGWVQFQLDRIGTFASPDAQTSPNVSVVGWADVPASWVSAAFGNGSWLYRARAISVVGAGPSVTGRYATPVAFTQAGGAGIARTLYLYVNKSVYTPPAAVGTAARSLYLYVNKSVVSVLASRSLYLYVNRTVRFDPPYPRSLYLYRNSRDGEVFPWLNHISPEEQYELGQVDLYGDGFGQYLDCTANPTTLSVSSTNGGNVAENIRDGSASEWQSTDGAAAWVRFTFGAAKRIVGIALEGSRLASTSWGVPRFKFSDATQQDGTVAVPVPVNPASGNGSSTEYPVGGERQLYWLATPVLTTYVEVAIASGGAGTNRGFTEAWVIEEAVPPEAAETSRAVLNLGLPSEQTMGIVAWQNRSPNFYPANSGVPPTPAATVTVPAGAVSGLVFVEESS